MSFGQKGPFFAIEIDGVEHLGGFFFCISFFSTVFYNQRKPIERDCTWMGSHSSTDKEQKGETEMKGNVD